MSAPLRTVGRGSLRSLPLALGGAVLLVSGATHVTGPALRASDWLAVTLRVSIVGPDTGLWITRAVGLVELVLLLLLVVPATRAVGGRVLLAAIAVWSVATVFAPPALALAPGGMAGLLGDRAVLSAIPLIVVGAAAYAAAVDGTPEAAR